MSIFFDPSPQQSTLFNWVRNEDGHALVRARAGTGKTTTILEAIRYMYGSVALIAFNKKIAEELKARLAASTKSKNYKAGTFHSYGFAAWIRYRPNVKMEGSENVGYWKFDRIVNDLDMDSMPFPRRKFMRALISKAKLYGIGAITKYSYKKFEWLEGHFNLIQDEYTNSDGENVYKNDLEDFLRANRTATEETFRAMMYRNAETMIEYGKKISDEVIDFDDMIYMPLADKKCFVWKYDWILVDECQDSSPIRRAFVRRMMKDGSRTIWVGDDKQAIYGFTGADSESIENILRDDAFQPITEFPLTVTYRCGKKIVDYAKTWTPDICAVEGAHEGEIMTMEEEQFLDMKLEPSDVILCRNTAPLINLALDFIRRGIGCKVEGRDIGKDLMRLAKKWRQVQSVGILAERLKKYEEVMIRQLRQRNQLVQAEAVSDTVQSLLAIIDSMNRYATIQDLEKKINSMFGDHKAGEIQKILTLSTIHKAKGREWDRVFWYGWSTLQPSRYAIQNWEREQEQNLMYVAVTRAKNTLVRVNMKSDEKAKSRNDRFGMLSDMELGIDADSDIIHDDSHELVAQDRTADRIRFDKLVA